MRWPRLTLLLALRALREPSLAVALVRVAWRFRRRHWLRHPPFLPLPDRKYLQWRMLTAYGAPETLPSPDEIARYARWAVRK